MAGARKALVVATYDYRDTGLRRLAAPQHDAESFAAVLEDPDVAGFDVTMLVNEPHHVVGEAIADFYAGCRRDDLALLYFSGHGLKDDEGRLHLAMSNTRREALLFTAISAAQLNDAMDASASRRKVLILDCCYSGAFPAGRAAKSDEGVQTLERFQGKGRAVLTASDATQYAFEGDSLTGAGSSSVFTRYLVEAIRSGAADLDEDGDIALDELYSYVRERVVADMPQQRPKKQEDVDGRILIARNVHWSLPAHLRHAIESPIAAQRLSAVDGLGHLHRVGNERVRAMVAERIAELADDDSRTVSAAATALMGRLGPAAPPPTASPIPPPRTSVSTAPAPVSTVAAPTAAAPTPAASTPAAPTPAAAASEPVAPRADEPSRPALPRPSLRAPRLTEEPPPEAATGAAGVPATYPVALVLSLVVIAGVLQLLSRFVVFEGTSGYHAADYGVATSPWLLAVGFPLLLASQILIVRAGEGWALALSAGLVAGAALSQVDLILATGSYFLREDTADVPGPGWWAAAIATVALVVCVVVVLRGAGFGERPRLRRDWRAIVATAVVMVALGAKLDAFSAAWPWFSQNAPALLLAAACLPLTLLALNGRQRWLGLTAVSVFGPWVCAAHVYAIVNQSFPVDQPAAVLAIVSAAVSVAACYLAQLRYRRASDRPATEPVGRR